MTPATGRSVTVSTNGPYIVKGSVPLAKRMGWMAPAHGIRVPKWVCCQTNPSEGATRD